MSWLQAQFLPCHQGSGEIKTMCSVCFRSEICMSVLYKSSKETSKRTDPKPPRSMDFFSPLNPMSFGSGPGGCQSSASPTEKLQSKCWCAVWQATAVRLADVSFMERILVLMSRISQWDPAQGSSCFSAWRRGWAYPTSGCSV